MYNDPEAYAHKLAKYAILQAGISQINNGKPKSSITAPKDPN